MNLNQISNLQYLSTINHKNLALNTLNQLLSYHIENNNFKKSNLLSYWFEDFCKYNLAEEKFNPRLLKRYKRGSVITVNLGFNVGNEERGLHYYIVLDKSNALSSGTLTVIPLTSKKENKQYNNSTVNLGNEIYLNLKKICANAYLNQKILDSNLQKSDFDINLKYFEKLQNEILKMKKGSIALVSQITTISKQRIYDPKTSFDILSNLRVSNHTLDLIDTKIKELFIK